MSEKQTGTKIAQAVGDDVPERAETGARSEFASGAHRTLGSKMHTLHSSTYATYLFGGAGAGDKPAWSDSASGRALIRLISRGLIGSLFFTVGGRIARRQLSNYHPEKDLTWHNEATGKLEHAPPLQWLARGIDRTLGRGVEGIAWAMADVSGAKTATDALLIRRNAAWNATDFRQKAYFHGVPGKLFTQVYSDGMKILRPYNGRSYGAEVVGVTFDFAMASIGDALTRNIFQGLDPNVRHTWMVDKDGKATTWDKGHFHLGNWAKAVGASAWRIFSKNQGEDWVAGPLYVFQMRYQRQWLNKMFKGSKLVFDNGWHGSAFKVNDQGQIIGDYMLPGAMDLHMRFVGYNWYTLMYREAYDAVADHWSKWRKGEAPLISLPHGNPITAAIDGAAHAVRYVAKSFIKTNLYMQPATIPFWIMRAPQAKWRGAFVRSDLPQLESGFGSSHSFDERFHEFCAHNPGVDPVDLRLRMLRHDPITNAYDHNYSTSRDRYPTMEGVHLERGKQLDTLHFGNTSVSGFKDKRPDLYSFKSYEHYDTSTWQGRWNKRFSQALNLPGKLCYSLGTGATKASDRWLTNGHRPDGEPINYLPGQGGVKGWLNRQMSWDPSVSASSPQNPTNRGREYFIRNYIDAAMAYTPYMWAKMETGLRIDEHKPNQQGAMDKAIYRLIDQTVAFNPRGVIGACYDIGRLAIHFDKQVKSREGEATPHAPVVDVVPASEKPEVPTTKIETATVRKEKHAPANDNGHEANDNERHDERSWAETVAGRHLGASFHGQGETRH